MCSHLILSFVFEICISDQQWVKGWWWSSNNLRQGYINTCSYFIDILCICMCMFNLYTDSELFFTVFPHSLFHFHTFCLWAIWLMESRPKKMWWGPRSQVFGVFRSKLSKNAFNTVHALFMQFAELEVEPTTKVFGQKKQLEENTNAVGPILWGKTQFFATFRAKKQGLSTLLTWVCQSTIHLTVTGSNTASHIFLLPSTWLQSGLGFTP